MTTVYADDYAVSGVVQISDVLTANPTGNLRILLEDGDYRCNGNIVRDNLTIEGAQKPYPASDNNSLIGGSIIKGTLYLSGNGVHVEKFGVDRGADVCTNLSLFPSDGLILGSNSSTIYTDVSAEKVIGLCKDSTVAFHAFLAQGLNKFDGNDIDGVYGYYACVFKVQKANVSNVRGRRAGSACVYIKSDVPTTGTACFNSNFNNIIACDTSVTNPTYGVIVHASTAPGYSINISNVNTIGAQSGFTIVGDLRSSGSFGTNSCRRVIANNINIHQPTVLGVNCYGGLGETSISNVNIYAPTTDRALEVQSDCLGLRLNNVLASLRAGSSITKADCISLAGRVWADRIHCIEDGDYTKKRGIKDNIEVISSVKYGSLTNTWGNVT